jgi:hypothetical protein
MDDDPYGFCHDLERSAVKAFDQAGLTAFARVARERFEQSCADPANYLRQPWGGAWRAIFAQQGSVQKYLELGEQTELTASDGETIAGMFQGKRRLDEALAWTERGLHLERRSSCFGAAGPKLGEMKRILRPQYPRPNLCGALTERVSTFFYATCSIRRVCR